MRIGACQLDARGASRLRATYQELHEGLAADRLVCEDVPVPVGRLAPLGEVLEIQYLKLVPDGEPSYWHPFAAHARPTLYRDSRGKLFVRGSGYKTTTRGIEDLATRLSHLPSPRRLVTLGRLQWIKYGNSVSGSHILRFEGTARPIVAHDEAGKLHFLRGTYQVEADPMAHRKSHRRPRAVRANPRGDFQKRAMAVGKMAVLVGGSALLSGYVLNMAFGRLPTMNPYLRGAAKVATGVVVPVLLAGTVMPDLLSGFAIAGVTAGAQDFYAAYRANNPARGLLAHAGGSAGLLGSPMMVGQQVTRGRVAVGR